ncbi:lipopolysaccharide assembly protein LapA domain-containing protein [Anianabacter salinae]|uniref:lipopolysaccharide assembly protein LapA domain-containing protein n=1 Tax=Anianabacter salinae TaxID=2851023 RepID=UPI00225DCFB6|nr:lipopolysaccharide assembly protein LapA domain-containing protein [Anianabacter salinae]MBV0912737.1 DUF1049 domain-containing protein [Anianabacter salinae]
MRYLRYAFLGTLAVCLIVVALANSAPVTLWLLPQDMGTLIGFAPSVTVPLFVPIFGGIVAGLLIGFVWEWLREHRFRAQATRERREREKLEREVRKAGLREEGGDDVIALLENAPAQRRA